MPRAANITGDPGETWTNDTGKAKYQFIVNWSNSCGLCAQYDRQIGDSWPIPLHRGCRCRQKAIWPGATSLPFADFRAEVASLSRDQQARVIGRANLLLVERGVVEWSDVVTPNRVRDLHEVVAAKGLTVEQMVKAAVPRAVAEKAYATVHTPAHELAEAQRADLVARLAAKGVEKAGLKRAVAERLAARVTIGAGPSGPQGSPVVPGDPKVLEDYLVASGVKAEVAKKAAAKVKAKAKVKVKVEKTADQKEAERVAAEAAKAAAEAARLKAERKEDERLARVEAEYFAKIEAEDKAKAAEAKAAAEKAAEAKAAAEKAAEAKAKVEKSAAAKAKVEKTAEEKKAEREARKQAKLEKERLEAEEIERKIREKYLAEKAGKEKASESLLDAPALALKESIRSAGETSYQEKLKLIGEWVDSRKSAPAPVKAHGMTSREQMSSLEWNGQTFRFADARNVLEKISDDLFDTFRKPPPPVLRAATREVVFTAQANKEDPYWKVKYNNPNHVSHATAGDGVIVVYNGNRLNQGTEVHESGHNLATKLYGSTAPGAASDYARAMATGEPAPSDYGMNSPDEDFAEAWRYYVDNPALFREKNPERFKVIDRLVTEKNYRG